MFVVQWKKWWLKQVYFSLWSDGEEERWWFSPGVCQDFLLTCDALACFLCVHVHTIILSICISQAFFYCDWSVVWLWSILRLCCMLKYTFPSLPRLRVAAHVTRSASLSGFNSLLTTTWSWSERSTAPWLVTAEMSKSLKVLGQKVLYMYAVQEDRQHTHTLRKQMWASTVCAQMPKLIESCTIGSIECVFRTM